MQSAKGRCGCAIALLIAQNDRAHHAAGRQGEEPGDHQRVLDLVVAAAVRAKFSQWITLNYLGVILVHTGWLAALKSSALAAG
jgi:hypothetical protein